MQAIAKAVLLEERSALVRDDANSHGKREEDDHGNSH